MRSCSSAASSVRREQSIAIRSMRSSSDSWGTSSTVTCRPVTDRDCDQFARGARGEVVNRSIGCEHQRAAITIESLPIKDRGSAER